jgi:hypothetical protein
MNKLKKMLQKKKSKQTITLKKKHQRHEPFSFEQERRKKIPMCLGVIDLFILILFM